MPLKDKLVFIGGLVVLGFALWWAVQKKDAPAKAEPDVSSPPAALGRLTRDAIPKFEAALAESEMALRAGDYSRASRVMYRAFPEFESHLSNSGYKEIKPGLTLRDWFETAKEPLLGAIHDELPPLIEKVKAGDFSQRAAEEFLSHMPFAFANEARLHYQRERSAIAEARAKNATNWFLISVIATPGQPHNYEQIVRDALHARWNEQLNLKLVFDAPSGWEEQQAAAKFLAANIDEKYVTYASEGGDDRRGSGRVAELAFVTFTDRTARKDAPRMSWDVLPVIAVTNEVPERLRFKFKNQSQTADFSGLAAQQREALEKKLVEALGALPPLKSIAPREGGL